MERNYQPWRPAGLRHPAAALAGDNQVRRGVASTEVTFLPVNTGSQSEPSPCTWLSTAVRAISRAEWRFGGLGVMRGVSVLVLRC